MQWSRVQLRWLCLAWLFSAHILLVWGSLSADLELGKSIFSAPVSVALDPNSEALYVSDGLNGRVLRFDNRNTLTSSSMPTMAFGQASLNGTQNNLNQSTPSSEGLSSDPWGVFVDDAGTLWVSDSVNSRVVWYKNAAAITVMPHSADGVLGQPNFATFLPACARDRMSDPKGLRVSGSTLYVTDAGNNRYYFPLISVLRMLTQLTYISGC